MPKARDSLPEKPSHLWSNQWSIRVTKTSAGCKSRIVVEAMRLTNARKRSSSFFIGAIGNIGVKRLNSIADTG
jgi:hypothetical protein